MRTEIFWAAVCSLLLTSLGSASAQSTYRLTNLGTIDGGPTQGKAINSKGKVAGSAFRADGDGTAAVFWNGFRLRDLGTLGGNQSDGVAINSSGMVVGTAQIESAGTHAFLWSKGEMRDLGTLGGHSSFAFAINDAGFVTGGSLSAGPFEFEHAFLWDGTAMRDISECGAGRAINSAGWVAGGGACAFLWDGSTEHRLGTLGGPLSHAQAINEAGYVTGGADLPPDEEGESDFHAFLWDGSVMHDLGTLGGQFSFGKHINNAGWVAGDSSKSGDSRTQTHAFVWDGSLHDVGTLGGSRSVANGINASGQVIGFANTANNAAEHAFLWEDGKLYDLNDLIDPKDPLRDVTLTRAHDINDLGQIVATGVQSGKFRSFILSPTDYRIHGFFFPVSSPQWKLGRTVTVQVALADVVNGKLIRDGEAVALLTAPCRVKFSVSGAQTRVPRCMTYDRATNRFSYNWAIEKTGTGRATIAVDVSYLGTSTTMIGKSRNITITE